MVSLIVMSLLFVVGFFISTFFLNVSAKLYKTKNASYSLAMKVLWAPYLVGVIANIIQSSFVGSAGQIIYYVLLILGLVLAIGVAKTNYEVRGWRAFEIIFFGGFFSALFYGVISILGVIAFFSFR